MTMKKKKRRRREEDLTARQTHVSKRNLCGESGETLHRVWGNKRERWLRRDVEQTWETSEMREN